MSIFNKFFEIGEENVFKKAAVLAETAIEANGLLIEFMKTKDNLKEIKAVEQKGDREYFKLVNFITSGAVAPNIIDNMLELMDKEDNMTDAIHNLARELHRYNPKNRKIEKIIQNYIKEITDIVEVALNVLVKMHNQSDINQVIQMRNSIAQFEEKVDDIKDKLIDLAYNTKTDFKTFHQLIEIAHIGDDILDNCQDSSDLILVIMTSILT
jgi:uncharacterized protein Yka (UPF0111/DUF47 family)